MCGVAEAGLAITALSAVSKSQTDQDQARYTSQVAQNNAITAQYAADDATRRAELEAQKVQRNTSQLVGTQRAGFAAKGLDISEGTPGDIIDQTNFFGKVDADTARYNGKLDAYGKRVQAQNFNSQASAATYNGGQAAAGDLMSGAGAVGAGWYTYGLNKKYNLG